MIVPYDRRVSRMDRNGKWITALETLSKAVLFVVTIPNTLGDLNVIITGTFCAVKAAQLLLAIFVQS